MRTSRNLACVDGDGDGDGGVLVVRRAGFSLASSNLWLGDNAALFVKAVSTQ